MVKILHYGSLVKCSLGVYPSSLETACHLFHLPVAAENQWCWAHGTPNGLFSSERRRILGYMVSVFDLFLFWLLCRIVFLGRRISFGKTWLPSISWSEEVNQGSYGMAPNCYFLHHLQALVSLPPGAPLLLIIHYAICFILGPTLMVQIWFTC